MNKNAKYIVKTACVKCRYGSNLSFLQAGDKTKIGNQFVVTKNDTSRSCFEVPFGICSRTNKPCTLGMAPEWVRTTTSYRTGIYPAGIAKNEPVEKMLLRMQSPISLVTEESSLVCTDQGGYVYPVSTGQNDNPNTGAMTVTFDEKIHVFVIEDDTSKEFERFFTFTNSAYRDTSSIIDTIVTRALRSDQLDPHGTNLQKYSLYPYEFTGRIANAYLKFTIPDDDNEEGLPTTRMVISDDVDTDIKITHQSYITHEAWYKLQKLEEEATVSKGACDFAVKRMNATEKKMNQYLDDNFSLFKDYMLGQGSVRIMPGQALRYSLDNSGNLTITYSTPQQYTLAQAMLKNADEDETFLEYKAKMQQKKEEAEALKEVADEKENDLKKFLGTYVYGEDETPAADVITDLKYSGQYDVEAKMQKLNELGKIAQKLAYMIALGPNAITQFRSDIPRNANDNPFGVEYPTTWVRESNYGLWGRWYENLYGWHTGIDIHPGGDVHAILGGIVVYQTFFYICIYNAEIDKTLVYMHYSPDPDHENIEYLPNSGTEFGSRLPKLSFSNFDPIYDNEDDEEPTLLWEFAEVRQWEKIGTQGERAADGSPHTHFAVYNGVFSPSYQPARLRLRADDNTYAISTLELDDDNVPDISSIVSDNNYGQQYVLEEIKVNTTTTVSFAYKPAALRKYAMYKSDGTPFCYRLSDPDTEDSTTSAIHAGHDENKSAAPAVTDLYYSDNLLLNDIDIEEGAYTWVETNGNTVTDFPITIKKNVLVNGDGSLLKFENSFYRANGRMRPWATEDRNAGYYTPPLRGSAMSLSDVAPGRNFSENPYPVIMKIWTDAGGPSNTY